MKTVVTVVGVGELKSGLSRYLRSVALGGTVTIRDRKKRPIARIVPVSRSSDEECLNRLAECGVVRRGVGRPGLHLPVQPLREGRLSDIVIEDRR
jgi:antitoxin (DNA-binding transcriptional repressor) of toxin-antitoxin stability system